MYTAKRIDADRTIDGQLAKRWVLVGLDFIEHVSYEEFKSSPLPDITKRDFAGGIIYDWY